MKIMIDTNVLISAVYNLNSVPAKAVRLSCENHELILCDHIINECYEAVNKSFPQHVSVMDNLLDTLVYEIVVSPHSACSVISDPKDAPILNAAILHNVDIIISGDNHFKRLNMEHPKVMSPADFVNTYGTG
ncbi:MAG: putative toxin-antitoxin system toxin component, PIN family [Oscillospiraceae bacterium]|nr:putative toxin-antitoxin system toxin component, PIN family [Oscillospiraceae bacterium]